MPSRAYTVTYLTILPPELRLELFYFYLRTGYCDYYILCEIYRYVLLLDNWAEPLRYVFSDTVYGYRIPIL